MKQNKLTERAIARRICRAHNDYRKKHGMIKEVFKEVWTEDDDFLHMDKDETRARWQSWSKWPLKHRLRECFPEFKIPILSRPMTHAEARKLVAEQGILN